MTRIVCVGNEKTFLKYVTNIVSVSKNYIYFFQYLQINFFNFINWLLYNNYVICRSKYASLHKI